MPRSLLSLAGLIIFLIIVIGAGVLIYRFIVSDNAQVKIVLINSEGKFGTGEYTLANDEVFRVQNNSDKNQTVKKSSDKTTLVEVDANSSSRELSLSDNTESELFLAGDESQKTKVKVGSPPKEEESEAVPEARRDVLCRHDGARPVNRRKGRQLLDVCEGEKGHCGCHPCTLLRPAGRGLS